MVVNNLGGDMPQERLNRIKEAWKANFGTSDQDWEEFQPQEPTPSAIVYNIEIEPDVVILCPSWEEIARRLASRAKYHLLVSQKHGDTPTGIQHYNDWKFYRDMSDSFMKQHHENLRKGR